MKLRSKQEATSLIEILGSVENAQAFQDGLLQHRTVGPYEKTCGTLFGIDCCKLHVGKSIIADVNASEAW